MSHTSEMFLTIVTAIVGLALVSVLVSRNANTTGVVQAIASGLGNNIATAISPVTGADASPNLSYPGGGSFGNSFGF